MPHKTSPGGEPGLEGDFTKKTECIQHQNYNLPAQRFKNLFLAYSHAHGRVRLGDIDPATGKRKGQARTEYSAPTLTLVEDHLAGKGDSLGLVPILDDGETVQWGAIDIDEYEGEFPYAILCEQIANLKLPLVVARTKSGGAHCYLFLNEPTPAALVQSTLRNWSTKLGYSGVEIIPKQTRREGDKPTGWLNMPYYGDDRWAFDATARPLVLEAFLDFAEGRKVAPSALVPFEEIQEAVSAVVKKQLAGRNDFLFDLGCSLRGQGWSMEEIEAELRARNTAADVRDHPNFSDGPVDDAELRGIVQRVGRYEKGKRAKVRPGIPPGHRPSEEISISEARDQLKVIMKSWLENPGENPLLVMAAAGTGKSTTQTGLLAKEQNDLVTTHYHVPDVKLALEFVKRASMTTDPITGKEKAPLDCRAIVGRTYEDEDGKTLCTRPEVIREAASHGIRNIAEACCYKKATEGDEDYFCPHHSECAYYAQFESLPNTVILAHEYLFQPMSNLLGKPDRIIIDEDFLSSLIATPPGFSPSEIEGPYAEIIVAALEAGVSPKQALKDAGVTRKDLTEAATAIDKAVVADIHPGLSDEDFKAALKKARKAGPTPMVYRRLAEEINLDREATYSLTYNPSVERTVVDDEGNKSREKLPRVFVQYRRRMRIPKDTPVLLLDATANPELLEVAFPGLETVELMPKRNAYVIQATHMVASKDAMGKPKNIKDVGAFLRHLNALFGPGAVISHKGLIEVLDIPERWESGWFNGIRGSNRFEHCPYIVVIGRPQPKPTTMESHTRGLFYDQPVELSLGFHNYEVRERGYQMRNRELWGVDVWEHPDPHVQAMLETKREGGCEQSLDRPRLLNDGPTKTVFLLTSLPLNVTVDEIVPWNALLGVDDFAVAMQKLGGVLPLKAAWLAERLPELWKTAKAAERAIDWKTKKAHKPPVAFNNLYRPVGVCRIQTLDDAQAYEFRSKGQARATRVLSHLNAETTRQWLDDAFGPDCEILPPLEFEFIPATEPGGKPCAWLAAKALMWAFQILTGEIPSNPCCEGGGIT